MDINHVGAALNAAGPVQSQLHAQVSPKLQPHRPDDTDRLKRGLPHDIQPEHLRWLLLQLGGQAGVPS